MAMCLGTEERLDTVAPTSLKDAEGQPLDLAAKVTTKCFGLPYTIRSDGLVLKPREQHSKYYALPPADQLAQMQAASMVPRPLPTFTLSTADLILGHAVWLLLAGVITYGTISIRRTSDKPTVNPDGSVVQLARLGWRKSLGFSAVMTLIVWFMIVAVGFVVGLLRKLLLAI